MTRAPVGLIGKHPDYGDFLRHGLSDPIADGLMDWIDRTLSEVKDTAGSGWETLWDNAPRTRVWIGSGVFGATLAGIWQPSRDRVGRRYPLLFLVEGADLPAPVDPGHDPGPWVAMERHIMVMRGAPSGAAALLERFELSLPRAEITPNPVIWAHRPDGDVEALLQEAGPVDATCGSTLRSHWWRPGSPEGHPAAWLAHPGLPRAGSLTWILDAPPPQPSEARRPAPTARPETVPLSEAEAAARPAAVAGPAISLARGATRDSEVTARSALPPLPLPMLDDLETEPTKPPRGEGGA